MAENELSSLRAEIDVIDRRLTELFSDRLDVSEKIAAFKQKNGIAIYDPIRESEKLEMIASGAKDSVKPYVKQLYSLLSDISKDRQSRLIRTHSKLYDKINTAIGLTPKMPPDSPRVACRGAAGAFTSAVAGKLFKSPKIEYTKSYESVIRAVEGGYAQFGILPAGGEGIGDIYRLLEKSNVYIALTAVLKTEYCLLGNPGSSLGTIREIVSHEDAVTGCRDFIDALGDVKIIYSRSTADAAKQVSESGRLDIAAIASRQCTGIYDLETLKAGVQNAACGDMRFVCISKELFIYPGSDKTSVTFTVSDTAGSLFRVLSKFNSLGINLSSIKSLPVMGDGFAYRFFLGFDTPVYSEEFALLMQSIESSCDSFRYFGTYREII